MSEQTYTGQMIDQYLLGSLAEADTERLDELSVSDDEFVEALSAAEKDLVDAYVQGELSSAELESFESHFLASTLRREKVEFARTFQGWAEARSVGVVKAQRPDAVVEKRSALNWLGFFSRPLAWQWGFAAVALTLLIVSGVVVFQNVRLRRQVTETQTRHDEVLLREQKLKDDLEKQRQANSASEQELARVTEERERLEQELKQRSQLPDAGSVVSLILTPPLRGAGRVSTLSLRPGTTQVAAQLQLEAADYSAYQVLLIEPAAHETLWRSGKLKASVRSAGKALTVSFPASVLKSQTYILQVSGITASGKLEVMSDYPFKVVK